MIAPSLPIVAIPARNEETLLPRLIAALSRQTVFPQLGSPLSVVLVLNNTDDGSRKVVREAIQLATNLHFTVVDVEFPPERAHVGSARTLAMEIASTCVPSGLILTTDADAVPAHDWVEQNLRSIQAGADLVGGRIIGNPQEEERHGARFLSRARMYARYQELCDELASLLDPVTHDPWPRHHDHTGASIAVRSDVYRAVGGMDALPFREDIAFVSKAKAAGFRLRHAPEVTVTVSARTHGRARGGMADCLRNWMRQEEEGIPLLLEAPEAVESRLRLRRSIRDLDGMTPQLVRRRLHQWGLIPSHEIYGEQPFSICGLVERFAADELDAPGSVPAQVAIAALERRIADLKGLAHAA